ncbi:PREDICTED: cytochrome P450 4C1-like [Atta cephalotes]|uniref:Cytochrome P450 n=1 Tax=Atta cephalotes TaxID=12957 RepID=A0A158P394_ATTCE|nr:PREDICTED: cytochrome P450 4C1-like [Atta cephalotes]
MLISTFLLLILIVYLIYHYYVQYGPIGRLINNIPGPSGYPIIGNTLQLLISREDLWKLLKILSDKYSVWKLWSFFEYIVSIRHPDDLEIILSSTKHINKSRLYNVLHPWFGTGLLTSGGSKWQSRRKILTSAFHFNILQQFVEILIEESENMTKSLKNTEGTVVKNLVPFISEHTLNALCETTMGISLKEMNLDQQRYRDAVYKMNQIIIYRMMRQWLRNDWIFSLTPKGREQVKILKILHGFTKKIIAERKVYHKYTNGQYLKNFGEEAIVETDDVDNIKKRKKRLAMLDLLILASQENLLTDLDIREEVDTFMFEGHDTTAMGICFVLSLLAEHKDIQDRVRKEINAVIQENQGKLTMKSLLDLQYLERCIKEALRLYPSVYFISRMTSDYVQLKTQSYLLPPKTMLHLNIYGVHRDPNFWSNPEIFDPDRFLPEKIQNRHPYSYLPFSAGPRNCIGQRFALLEIKAIIVSLIHNFFLEPIDYLKNVRLVADLVIRPIDPHRIKFIPVKT